MDEGAIRTARSFNRTVTQRIGALNEEYLARDRSLGASRLLWEVGPEGSDARELRARLGLDSGYLSRLLRSLEGEGLLVVEADATDKRVRSIRLSDAGRAELGLLNRQSDELASSLLDPLSERQRERLLEAMAVVDQLLTVGMVETAIEDPSGEAAQFCIQSYFRDLDSRFEAGFDPDLSISADAAELTLPAGPSVLTVRIVSGGNLNLATFAFRLKGSTRGHPGILQATTPVPPSTPGSVIP